MVTVAMAAAVDAPDQPVNRYFVPPTVAGEVTLTCACAFSSYQQPPVAATPGEAHVGFPYGESIVRRNCRVYVAVRTFGASIVRVRDGVVLVAAPDHAEN